MSFSNLQWKSIRITEPNGNHLLSFEGLAVGSHTMDDSESFSEACKDARDLFDAGMYRKAPSKLKSTLTASPDERSIVDVSLWAIRCHEWLEEVSGTELIRLYRKELTIQSRSFSIRRCCSCNELELVLQGGISSGMADLLIHRGIALKHLGRFSSRKLDLPPPRR